MDITTVKFRSTYLPDLRTKYIHEQIHFTSHQPNMVLCSVTWIYFWVAWPAHSYFCTIPAGSFSQIQLWFVRLSIPTNDKVPFGEILIIWIDLNFWHDYTLILHLRTLCSVITGSEEYHDLFDVFISLGYLHLSSRMPTWGYVPETVAIFALR